MDDGILRTGHTFMVIHEACHAFYSFIIWIKEARANKTPILQTTSNWDDMIPQNKENHEWTSTYEYTSFHTHMYENRWHMKGKGMRHALIIPYKMIKSNSSWHSKNVFMKNRSLLVSRPEASLVIRIKPSYMALKNTRF